MIRYILSSVLFAVSLACADDFAVQRAEVLALSKLTAPPVMMAAEGYGREGRLQAIYFDGLEYGGKPTKVFAWVGIPQERKGKVPGIVLLHGGGGTAFSEWVEKWKERGFAAIAIALEGQIDQRNDRRKWMKHAWPGPSRPGHYRDSAKPLKDQWMYHAVADTILANSLLRSLPEVNAKQVGIMGVSWGGVITSTVMGIDSRFAFAIPTYGCGHMADVDNHWGAALGENTLYREVWEPMHYLPQAKMPALWFSWPKDHHFPLDSQAASYRAMSGDYMVALLPDMKHSCPASWNPPDSYAFAESVIRDGKPWCPQISAHLSGDAVEVTFSSSKPLDHAVLFSTVDRGYTGSRKWVESPADLQQRNGQWVVKSTLPSGSTAWFVNVRSNDLTASSSFQEVSIVSR